MSAIAERKARYENSALRQLMEASGHEICERCYCCDVVTESATCWNCGGFADDDCDEGWLDICSECGGEGKLFWRACIGRCDKDGNHEQASQGVADPEAPDQEQRIVETRARDRGKP